MAVNTPDTATQVEERIKVDVQREAVDSNPYLKVHWLRSLIAGIARRIFDFYRDLNRTEQRLMPDTADSTTAPRWGNILVGPSNPAAGSTGQIVATGNAGGVVPIGAVMVANGLEFTTTTSDTVAATVFPVLEITRSGNIATVVTDGEHGLSSFVPVTIVGAVDPEYNVSNATITVTGLDSFTYVVSGSPPTPATGGSITANFTAANVTVVSTDVGDGVNLSLDTPLSLQSPIVDVDNTLYVTFATVGGGVEEESVADYRDRYLDKIRNPVAHFNAADITAKAKEVPGVTRVFVEKAGQVIGSVELSSLTRNLNVATAVCASPHGFTDGQITTIEGANQPEYNVIDARIIIENDTTFHYIVNGTPTSPATGIITAATTVPLGQVRTYFMRDNDANPIPSASEVATVKLKINEILPANTSEEDNVVLAPVAAAVNYTFSSLVPDTPTMRIAVENNLQQFHDERTTVGVDVDEDAYRSAIINTIDPDTGDIVSSFELASPVGDIGVSSGRIATKGTVTF